MSEGMHSKSAGWFGTCSGFPLANFRVAVDFEPAMKEVICLLGLEGFAQSAVKTCRRILFIVGNAGHC